MTPTPISRRSLTRRVRARSGCPAYASDFKLIRGRCLAPKCRAQWGVVRVTLDFTDASTDHNLALATVECAKCGRTWYRTRTPKFGQYQSTRLTLILPGDQRRWYARGRYHVQGEAAITIPEATLSDMLAARDDWRKRFDRHADSKAKAKAKAALESAAATAAAQEWLAQMGETRKVREADEAAAAAREKAGLA